MLETHSISSIISNGGSNYYSKLFKALLEKYGVYHII